MGGALWHEIVLGAIGLFVLAEGASRLGEWLIGGADRLVRRRLDDWFGPEPAPAQPEPDEVRRLREGGVL
ncbi:MAG TPA: hypothetical protein VGW34_10570 [Allosphingosinicella sp.]|nr:hypothetical protein [Allosphingosinicella sp.]